MRGRWPNGAAEARSAGITGSMRRARAPRRSCGVACGHDRRKQARPGSSSMARCRWTRSLAGSSRRSCTVSPSRSPGVGRCRQPAGRRAGGRLGAGLRRARRGDPAARGASRRQLRGREVDDGEGRAAAARAVVGGSAAARAGRAARPVWPNRMAARHAAREDRRLSLAHRVLSPFTAMLVLETEEDYRRFELDRRALADILVVGDAGLDVLQRDPLKVLAGAPEATEDPSRSAVAGGAGHAGFCRAGRRRGQ